MRNLNEYLTEPVSRLSMCIMEVVLHSSAMKDPSERQLNGKPFSQANCADIKYPAESIC